MEFKIGFKHKPDRVDTKGVVYFTDGVNEVPVNQVTCEAYGYRYNKFNGTCEMHKAKSNLSNAFEKTRNTSNGAKNKFNAKTVNVLVNGSENNAEGDNNNVIINGNKNIVASGVNNAAILSGDYGTAIRTGEVLFGGSTQIGLDNLSNQNGISRTGNGTFRTQTSKFHCSAMHTLNSITQYATLSGLNGIYGIPMHRNSVGFVKATVIGVMQGSNTKYVTTFESVVTKNNTDIADVSYLDVKTALVNTVGLIQVNFVDGSQANSDTSSTDYNEGELYVVINHSGGFGGAAANTTWSVAIEINEQIHSEGVDLITN